MSGENIIRAWKDAGFRNSLSDKERALLLENSAGLVELTDTDLNAVGGMAGYKCGTWTGTLGRCNPCSCNAICDFG